MVARRIDYENDTDPKQISSLLTVYEPHMPNRTVNATLLVIIKNINDNPPIFSEDVRIYMFLLILSYCLHFTRSTTSHSAAGWDIGGSVCPFIRAMGGR